MPESRRRRENEAEFSEEHEEDKGRVKVLTAADRHLLFRHRVRRDGVEMDGRHLDGVVQASTVLLQLA